jgi:hypothetical protein
MPEYITGNSDSHRLKTKSPETGIFNLLFDFVTENINLYKTRS